jgi:predicted DNA-binding transcriptional regulator YafY
MLRECVMPKKFFERFKRIDYLIRSKSTGTPRDLADKLEISVSTLYEFISFMKEMGAPVKYDKAKRSYVYERDVKFKIEFEAANRL